MDKEQAIFILIDQAEKHEFIADVAKAMDEPDFAKDHGAIAEALRYAIRELDLDGEAG